MALAVLPRQLIVDANGTPRAAARAYYYQAGTVTPISVYTTGDYSTAHTQPVESASSGLFPAVHVNPAVNTTYKLVVQDSAGVDLYNEDNLPALGFTSSDIGATLDSLKRTPAEIAVGVTPVNYAYAPLPEIDGSRHGFVGDDLTNNDTALADAIAVLGLVTVSGGILRLPAGTYRFSTGISLPVGMCIAGTSYRSTILKYTGSGTAITIPANISQCALRDIQILGNAKTGTGLQLGTTDFCDLNFFERIWITGFAVGVRLGATFANTFKDCRVTGNVVGVDFNASFAAGATNATSFYGCYIASNDRNGVDASNVPVRNIGIAFYNCTIENNCNSAPSTYPQFYLNEVQNFVLSACYFEYNLGGTPPDIIKANGLSNGRIDACFFNTYATAIHDTAGTSVSDVTISGCRATGGTTASVNLTTETRVIVDLTNLWDSTVTLTGTDCQQYTKPNAQQLVTDTTFTPTLIGSTVAGTQTYTTQVGFYSHIGNQVFFYGRVTISAKDGAMAGNAQLGGLPLTSANHANGYFQCEVICSNVTHAAGYTAFRGMIGPNGTTMDLMEEGTAAAESNVPVANLAANTTIRFSGVYTV